MVFDPTLVPLPEEEEDLAESAVNPLFEEVYAPLLPHELPYEGEEPIEQDPKSEDEDMSGKAPEAPPMEEDHPEESRHVREIRIGNPTAFSGDRYKLKTFLQECDLYLLVNAAIYDNDAKRIAFVLSHINGGEAVQWKEQFLTSCRRGGAFRLGTYTDFVEKLQEAFKEEESVHTALWELNNLKQGGKSIEEHNIAFRLLCGKAGIATTPESPLLIEIYRQSLNPGVLSKIFSLESVPTTIETWMSKAATIDNHWRQKQRILGKVLPKKTQTQGGRRFNFGQYASQNSRRDPNAMDIDAVNTSRTPDWHKTAKCYNCQRTGHIAKNCKDPKRPREGNTSGPPKMKGKDLVHHIRSLVDQMDPEDADVFQKMWEDEEKGFQEGDL